VKRWRIHYSHYSRFMKKNVRADAFIQAGNAERAEEIFTHGHPSATVLAVDEAYTQEEVPLRLRGRSITTVELPDDK